MKKNIWLILDGKKGHDKQSEALVSSLSKLIELRVFRINASTLLKNLLSFFINKFDNQKKLPKPDILIGAGHGTHANLILNRIKYGGISCAIMKPSLPLGLFDLCLLPFHDSVFRKKNIFRTNGPITKLKPIKKNKKNEGLILIGGLSKHFNWSNDLIIKRVNEIVSKNQKLEIYLSNSRRTPKDFIVELRKKMNYPIKINEYEKQEPGWIEEKMITTKYSWVTEDSISMIYELISTGSDVTCIELEKKSSKLRKITNQLFYEKKINFMKKKNKKLIRHKSDLSEADRCAKYILDKFF